MTIEFKEEQIVSREEKTRKTYIGYFAPNGALIDYNILLGGNYHDSWQNPVSLAFLSYVSYIVKGTSIEKLKEWAMFPDLVNNNQYPGINEYVIRGYGIDYDLNYQNIDTFLEGLYDRISNIEKTWHKLGNIDDYTLFEYQLLLFFRNAYKDKKFFDSIQRKIAVENPNAVKERLRYEYRNSNLSNDKLESIYCSHLEKELLSNLKDICVQYLGYDSLERFTPTITEIKVPNWYADYVFDFLSYPRIITTSYPNPNERYFNYLVMDWIVHKLPRYYYNEQTGLYEKCDFFTFYQSEKEQMLEQEIQSIKKHVPLKERKKYFR